MVKMASDTLILGAVGDIAAFHNDPESTFEHVAKVLKDADISFAQNERHYSNARVTPVGGFSEQVPPKHAESLKTGGFDVLSFASNHCMDLGEDVMMETVGVLRNLGFTVIGVGRNIAEARKPAIIERNGTKVAFLAYASVLRPNYQADVHKAGCAPMRAYTLYHQADYQPGTPPHILTFPNKADLAAIIEDVKKVRSQADIVAVSFHWGVHFVHAVIADYEKEVAHAVIDAGADVILGHHPHMLKGIEVYKGKPIFYSMGNFAFDLPKEVLDGWVKSAPYMKDAFKEQGWAYGDPEWPIYTFPPASRKSMIVRCNIKNKKIERACFLPCLINNRAQPMILSRGDNAFNEIFQYMKEITASQNLKTELSIEGDEIVVPLA
jgi:poly-gamma-glutamate synthesis protein (capsule biosynthesis protein)